MTMLVSVRVLLAFIALAGFVSTAQARPNIVLIMADDIGLECYTPYGGESYQTPTAERLATEGVRFTHCYSQPVCTPSRNKIMTGRGNRRNYIGFGTLLNTEVTFGHMMQAAGYKTAVAGKWQLTGANPAWKTNGRGSTPEQAGFDEYSLWAYEHNLTPEQFERYQSESGLRGKTSRFWAPAVLQNGKLLPTDRDTYGPDLYSDFALDFIERNQDESFFLYYPMTLTHSPFVATPHSGSVADTQKFRSDRKHFGGMVEYMDFLIGRLVDKLDELGLSENTLVLVTGDNGTMRGVESRRNGKIVMGMKAHPVDAGTHVALFARWLGKTPGGEVNDDLIDFSDFLPTIADAAAATRPKRPLDGRSFLPQILGAQGNPREFILMDYDKDPDMDRKQFAPVRFARTQRYKLYSDGRFFDIPYDREELRAIPPGRAGALGEQIRARLEEVLTSVPTWRK